MVALSDFDRIVINTSGGKDSQTMMRVVVEQAEAEGVTDRLVAVHADLGRVEWPGTRELAEEQAEHYGLRFIVCSRPQGDLLDHVAERGMWPSNAARYCTSDHKRGQVRKVLTSLVKEMGLGRPAKLLNCMGLRAQESSARAKKVPMRYDRPASGQGTVREVWEWLPILDWTEAQVWDDIRTHDVAHHPAYDLGMPRLSCCFCVLSNRSALTLAAQHNPGLAKQYLAVEVKTGHRFTEALSMAEIVEAADTVLHEGVSP
jgi:3'-phosphoadenosine 5'-phosphosulfate sulfotransferase (PAPS reductase)/FAD synthetase